MPNFFTSWDRDAYYATIDKLKQVDYHTLCLAHFGFIHRDEAKDILDQSVATYERWWELFGKHVERLDDIDYMLQVVLKEMISPHGDSFLRGLLVDNDRLLETLITTYKTDENLLV